MLSLAKLFGKNDRFFTLLDASAASALKSIEALERLLHSSNGEVCLAELATARRHDKKTSELISDELLKTFVTTLDREDIETLSRALYNIPKTVEKFGERFEIMHHLVTGEDFAAQMSVAKESAVVICRMVSMISSSPKLEDVKAENDQLQALETRGDQLLLGYLKEIYRGDMDPIKAMAKRDLYDLLEKVIDRCRDVGEIVTQIVLKNS